MAGVERGRPGMGLLLGLGSAACVLLLGVYIAPPGGPPALPPAPPTSHWLDADLKQDKKLRRKAWFKELQKAPPGVDAEAIERARGLAIVQRRAERARARAAAPAPAPSPWVERGSDNLAGRAHVAALGSDGETLYMGSSRGGVWRSDLDGSSWTPLGDDLYGGAHWLVLPGPEEAGAPDIMLAATDAGLVHRSVDDGLSWEEPAGLDQVWGVRRLVMTSEGSEAIFMVAWQTSSYRVLRSLDAGASFEELLDLGDFAGDLWVPRDGGEGVYLVASGELLHSTDLGETWAILGTHTAAERAELAGSEAGAPRLWLAMDGNTLVRSDDLGQTWEGAQLMADYWGTLAASIVDPELVAWGGVELRVSRDGASFAVLNEWSDYYADPAGRLHADMMGVDVFPVEDASDTGGAAGPAGEVWYINTDGGIYESVDGLRTVENLSLRGLRISQYYSTLTSVSDPDRLAAGSQDQGWQVSQGPPSASGVYDLEQLWSGDYGHLSSGDGTLELVYGVYPGFVIIQVGQDDPVLAYVTFPDGLRAWLPPVVADPEDPEVFYLSGQELLRYERRATWAWEPVDWTDQTFGGSVDAYMSALAFSPVDPDRVYAASNDGHVYVSDDHGRTWTDMGDVGPDAHYFYGHALLPSSRDRDTAWLGGSGYGAGAAIYRTTDGGRTWEAFDSGVGDTLVYALGEVPDGSGRLVAGTQTGALRRDPGMEEWVDITRTEAPVTTYWSVEALPGSNAMRFGTYGRGIWDYHPDLDEEITWTWPEDTGEDGDAGQGSGSEGGGGGGEPTGCGCATSSSATSSEVAPRLGALLGLLGLLGLRRRGD